MTIPPLHPVEDGCPSPKNRYEPFDANKHNPEEYDRDDKCINYDYHMDEHSFRIEEVDVIE